MRVGDVGADVVVVRFGGDRDAPEGEFGENRRVLSRLFYAARELITETRSSALRRTISQAAHWYRKAAEAGSRGAQVEYGLLFAQGQGVSLDNVQAYAWMELAASTGDSDAFENRDHLLTLLSASQKEAARKLAADYLRLYAPKK